MPWLRSRWTLFVALVLVNAAVVALVYLRFGPPRSASEPLEVASWASTIVAVALSTLQIALSLSRRSTAAEKASTPDQLAHAKRMIARASGHYVERQIDRHDLDRTAPLQVRWSVSGQDPTDVRRMAKSVGVAVSNRRVLKLTLSGTIDDVIARFDHLAAPRLVLLGAAGAGKTSLALLLARELLRRHRDDRPVPVVLAASSWDPSTEDLQEWLVDRLTTDYPGLANTAAYGGTAALRLVLDGELLPILDGLDELPDRPRTAAFRQLRQLPKRLPLVLTCRTDQFRRLEKGGTVDAATPIIEIRPLTAAEALSYLAAADERWEPLRDRVERGENIGPMAGVLTSPLMVFMAMSVVAAGDREPAELLALTSKAEISNNLLDRFVPAAVDRHHRFVAATSRAEARSTGRSERPTRWNKDKAQAYATVLASHVKRDGTGELRWWTLQHSFRKGGGTFPITALLSTLGATTLARFITTGNPVPTGVDIALAGLAMFLVAFFVNLGPDRAGIRMQPTLNIGSGLAVLGAALTGGVVGHLTDWTIGLAAGAATASSVLTFTRWLAARIDRRERMITARRLLRGVRNTAVAGALTWGTGFATMAWLTTQDAPVAAAVGVGGALVQLRVSPWAHWVDARISAAFHRQLPLRLMRLLDDFARVGVLRETGPTYQFRHEALATRLAEHNGRR
jgi:hypothetical protein